MLKPAYSIIIPHRNCPALLNRCVESIPKRKDVQLIVVDDNSDDDKKPSITRNDVELVMLNAEHSKWAGRARNVGLERAKGKWLLFADADDCFTSHLPQLLDKYADDEATDIVYLNACSFDDNGTVRPFYIDRLIKNYIKGKRDSEQNLRYGCWTSWTRMVKREIVVKNNIRFDETPAGNDVMFGLKTSMYAKSIGIEKEMVYQYYQWPNGSITQKMREAMIEERLELRGKVINFYNMVGYRSCINFLGLFVCFIRKGKLTVRQAIQIYGKYLKQFHVFWGRDVLCGCYEVFQHFICYGVRKVLKKADC